MNTIMNFQTAMKLALVALLAALTSAPVRADGPGSTTADLLKIPVGARAIGMGEAYTAAANDSSALQWNPAGLSFAQRKEASFMHSSLIEGVNYEHIAFAAPGDNFSYGLSMSYLGYGDIAGYDNNANPTGDLSANAYIFTAGASTLLRNNLSLGVSASVLRQKLADTSAGTFAGNAGLIYTLPTKALGANYKVGVSVLNVGPGLKFVSERAPLPRKIKVGTSIENIKGKPLNLSLDVTKPNDNDTYVGVGSEYWFKQLIAVRLGYAGSNDEGRGLRMGLGLKIRDLLFDYAYGSFGDFGATHRIGLAFQWGERMKQLNPEQRRVMVEAKRAAEVGDYAEQINLLEGLAQEDPTNTRYLKMMIAAHDKMLKGELQDAIAKTDQDQTIPNPEDLALKEIVPGQEPYAQGVNSALDPLGLENLPDVENLDGTASMAAYNPPVPTLQEAVRENPAAPVVEPEMLNNNDPLPGEPGAVEPAGDVMINPADIYNQ